MYHRWRRFKHAVLFRYWAFRQFLFTLRCEVRSYGDLVDVVRNLFRSSVIRGHIAVEVFSEIDSRLEDLDRWDAGKFLKAPDWYLLDRCRSSIGMIVRLGEKNGFLPGFIGRVELHLDECPSCRGRMCDTVREHASLKLTMSDFPRMPATEKKGFTEQLMAEIERREKKLEASRPRPVTGVSDDGE